ncbi:MAG: periplasmic heavy metal sensor [Pseudomonadota bacterium]
MNGLGRWTKVLGVVLVVSLAFNFFLIGWMGARWVYDQHMGPKFSVTRLVHDLPDEQREAVLAVFENNRDKVHEAMDSLRDARHAVSDVMLAEPFDAEAAAAALAELRRQSTTMQETMHAALLEAAVNLPPETRVDLGRFATMPRAR